MLRIERVIGGPGVAAHWRLYQRAFEELRATAALRHFMTRQEFEDVLADERVSKYVVEDPSGEACALGTMTNQLEAMPLISPEYFAARWPEYAAQRRIWYIGFVAVDPRHHGTGAFAEVVSAMTALVSSCGGVAALDVCRRNEQLYQLPAAIQRLVRTDSPGVEVSRIDEQATWAYEVPTPLPAQGERSPTSAGRTARR